MDDAAGEVVVGIDGSDHARRALAFAADEARRRGARLRVVHAWALVVHWPGLPYRGHGADEEVAEQQATHERLVAAAVADVVAEAAGDGLDVVTEVVHGPPAQVLLARGEDAEVLVVGTRGLGGFKGLLLGSVAQQVAGHAACAVIVVP